MATQDEIENTINKIAAQVIVAEQALHGVLRSLSDETKETVAKELRASIANVMQIHANGFTPQMDKQMTLALAATLEALGQPPQR